MRARTGDSLGYSLWRIADIYQDMTDDVLSLLRFLSDNRFHTFDEVRNETGISRAEAAWMLTNFTAIGIESEVVPKAGAG